MTPYERIYARLEGKKTDRIPNLCILMTFAAKEFGIPYGKYVTDYRMLVDASMKCCEKYGIDLLCAISDPAREAEGFGADVVIPEDGVPYIRGHLIDKLSDISKLKVCRPETNFRMNDRLEAVRLFKERSNGHHSVCGWVEGALAEACDLRNINNFMMDLLDEPEAAEELLEICTEQAIEFAIAQINAGADMIGIGDAAASLIGPRLYEQYALPYEKRIIDAVHSAGAKAKLHICGNINPLLPKLPETDADIIDCDSMVDFKSAVNTFGNNCSASGNFDTVSVLLQGTTKKVYEAVSACVSAASVNTMIAAGCEVPRNTPPENLAAVAQILRKL